MTSVRGQGEHKRDGPNSRGHPFRTRSYDDIWIISRRIDGQVIVVAVIGTRVTGSREDRLPLRSSLEKDVAQRAQFSVSRTGFAQPPTGAGDFGDVIGDNLIIGIVDADGGVETNIDLLRRAWSNR